MRRILFVSLLAAPGTAAVADDGEPAARREVEEIVVHARRREELIGDTPVAVTALSGEVLQENAITRLDEIQDLVPNLSFYSGRSGLTSAVFIRGVGQVDPISTFDPGVGIYVDGVYMSRQAGSVLNVVDVQSVEVLRGPQGTLFGKNTVGGAIIVQTTKPQEDFEALVRVGGGSFGTYRTRFTLNAPVELGSLGDRLFGRFTVASESSRGCTRNRFSDPWATDTNSLAALAALRLLATDDIEINVTGSWFRDHNNGKGGRCIVAQDPAPLAGALPADFLDQCRASRPFRFEADTAGLSDIESYGVWGDINWHVGELGWFEDLNIKSISSWREQIPRIREDGDMTREFVLRLASLGGDGPFTGEPGFQRQFSEELQLNGTAFDERLNFVAGVYGFWETSTEFQNILSLPMLPPQFGSNTDADLEVDNWSWAPFGQATFDPTEWLSLTAGLRYTKEKKGFKKLQTNALLPDTTPLVNADERTTFSAWTPMANIKLSVPEDRLGDGPLDAMMIYFTYSRGFKSGGFNGNARTSDEDSLARFDPETLDSYEVGIKASAFDQRLSAATALFVGKYRDIQVSSVEPGGSALAQLIVRNAARATIQGIEVEAEARPFADLILQGSVGLLDAVYDEFGRTCGEPDSTATDCSPSSLTGMPLDRSGESFNNVPGFESHVTVRYAWELPDLGTDWLVATLTPRLDYSYRSSVHYQGPELKAATQRGYNLLNARLALDFNDDRSQIALTAKNLTDQEYFQQNQPTASTLGTVVRYYEPPRSFLVEVSHRF